MGGGAAAGPSPKLILPPTPLQISISPPCPPSSGFALPEGTEVSHPLRESGGELGAALSLKCGLVLGKLGSDLLRLTLVTNTLPLLPSDP